MKKLIFGCCYKFDADQLLHPLLEKSVAPYPSADNQEAEVYVRVTKKVEVPDILSVNPELHAKTSAGMLVKLGNHQVLWQQSSHGIVSATMEFCWQNYGLELLKRLVSVEYSTELELFEQVLHELVLIPSIYFRDDLAPVHAASFNYRSKAVLLAGSGGVGKSSALLSLRKDCSVEFIADDITVIDTRGNAHPNFAWPKIYGYNCIKDEEVRKKLLKNRGFIDCCQFHVKNWIDPKSVRRKAKPDILFAGMSKSAATIGTVIILFRTNCDHCSLNELNSVTAAKMCVDIMCTEYSEFHNSIYWEQYNSRGLGVKPALDFFKTLSHWEHTYLKVFESVPVYILRIPHRISYDMYICSIRDFLGQISSQWL